jgi:hypothetical protein
VKAEIERGEYRFEDDVVVKRLHSKGEKFREIGKMKLVHDKDGFRLEGEEAGKEFLLTRPVNSMYSCHIEYNFKKQGDALELCNLQDTYFVHPQGYDNIVTKIHFATEEMYKLDKLTRKEPARRRVESKKTAEQS